LRRQNRLVKHRRRRVHELADLSRLLRPLVGRENRGVGLVLYGQD
jgi:hypothetical protein